MTDLQRVSYSSFLVRNLITLAGLLCLLGAAAQAQLKFNKPDFDTGKGPVSVAAADFNRDGFLDIVTANSRDNSITVLINNGNSTFGRRTDYPAGKNPVAVLTADFNQDGFADVAVLNQDDNSISIFLGNGDGTLRSSVILATGQRPDIMISADFNKDGKPDLAIVNNASDTLTIYLGKGDGTFTHSADYSSSPGDPSFQNLDGIAAADFNGDGILDLAVTNGRSDNVSIFLGKPDGTFTAAGSFTLFGGASGVVDGHIVTADFNQDGKADLLVQFLDCRQRGCTDGSMIFAGHGDGTFGSETSFPFNGFEPMIVADVNGDHVPDVIGSDGLVLVNPATVFSTGAVATLMPSAGLGPLALVAADFNGDGKMDVVTANSQDDTVSLLQGKGDGSFHQFFRMPFADPNFAPDSVVTADFNRDGIPDLVLKNIDERGIWLYLGKGDGTFQTPVQMSTDLEVFSMATADLNNDGIPDLLLQGLDAHGGNPTNRALLGNGDGTFRTAIDSPGRVAFTEGMRLADVNSDGSLDVVTLTFDNSSTTLQDAIAVSLGNGDGSFRAPVLTDVPFATSGLGVGDFDRDGKMDVVVGFTNISSNFESFVIYLGNGDGTFHAGQKYSAPGSPAAFANADLNHDGLLDLVVLHGRSAALFFGNGDGTFKQAADMPIFGEPSQVQVADVNGDGKPDIVVANERISIFMGNGDGSFQPRQDFATGGAAGAALGDFNHDGAADIVVASSNFPAGSISLLLTGSGPPSVRDFVLSISSGSQMLKAGQSAATNVSIIGVGIFQDSVSFACTGLPAGAACSFNPSAIAPGSNGQASAVLTISTTAPMSSSLRPSGQGRIALALGLPIFGLVLFGAGMRNRSTLVVVLVVLAVAVPLLQGCAGGASAFNGGNGGQGGGSGSGGNGGSGSSGTPTGTYTVTVVATSAGSPAITHSQTIKLTVQ